jgi:WD40 repeat protein
VRTKFVRNAFKGHTKGVYNLDFSPNDRLLVSTSDDRTIRVWNMHDGAVRLLIEDSLSYRCVFSPDGRSVVASHEDGMVRIWDVRTGQLIRRVQAHEDQMYDVAFMPDGKGFVSASEDTTMKYWDITSLDTDEFLEREFLGHKVRRFYFLSLIFTPFL